MPTMNDKETIKDYFTYLYNLSKLSKTDFAKELDVSQPVVSNVLTGERGVSANLIKNVYTKYGINLETIDNKELIKELYYNVIKNKNRSDINTIVEFLTQGIKNPENELNLIKIPYYNVKAAAGDGIENFNIRPDDVYYFDKRLLPKTNTSNLSAITASGDSMDSGCNKSSDIKDGDLLIVNNNDIEPVDGGIYVLLFNNKDLRVKKIQIDYDGCFKIVSNNPDYPVETYNPNSKDNKFEIRIIGKVLWNGSRGVI